MTGTECQLQLADQIRQRVAQEFDRVASAFRLAAEKQPEVDRAETSGMIAILEDKRAEVMANHEAGYFISQWQELDGRVRQMIAQDPRFAAIKAGREARRQHTSGAPPAGAIDSIQTAGRS
jgi:hypothetical protein